MANTANVRNQEILNVASQGAAEAFNWFSVLPGRGREKLPLVISFGAGTGGTVVVQGRNGPNDDVVTVSSKTADFAALTDVYPQMRVDLQGAPSGRTIVVSLGFCTLRDTGA